MDKHKPAGSSHRAADVRSCRHRSCRSWLCRRGSPSYTAHGRVRTRSSRRHRDRRASTSRRCIPHRPPSSLGTGRSRAGTARAPPPCFGVRGSCRHDPEYTGTSTAHAGRCRSRNHAVGYRISLRSLLRMLCHTHHTWDGSSGHQARSRGRGLNEYQAVAADPANRVAALRVSRHSRTMRSMSSPQEGISSMSPITMPAVTMPLLIAPLRSASLPRAPVTR